MRRYALAPSGPTDEQVVVAIPRRAGHWTIAQKNRGMHRILVPVDGAMETYAALRYVVQQLSEHLAAIHLVNVQRPVMVGDVTPLVSTRVVTQLRKAAGERILRAAEDMVGEDAIPVTAEVVFGAPAESICRVADERGCTGIVIGVKTGFELADLIVGSVASRVLKLACVPVTIVNRRTAASANAADRGTSLPKSMVRSLREEAQVADTTAMS